MRPSILSRPFGLGTCFFSLTACLSWPLTFASEPGAADPVTLAELSLDLDGSGTVAPADIIAGLDAINGVPASKRTRVPTVSELQALAEGIKRGSFSTTHNDVSVGGSSNAGGAVAGGVAQAEIVLVPSTLGPYFFNETIDIDVFLESFDTDDHLLRFVQLDLSQSDPAIGLPGTFSWDFSSVAGGGSGHFVFNALPRPSIAYLGLSADPNEMLLLPGGGSLHVGTLVGVQVPAAAGSYLLDAAHASGTAPDFTAAILFGFGVEPDDPAVAWYASTGEIAGGQLFLEVVACTDDAECSDGDACNGMELCDAGACMPGTPPDCDDGISCTDDRCDTALGGCVNEPMNAACDDGLFCNGVEQCDPLSGCVTGDVPCPPNLECDEENDECFDPRIPTVSSWGMVILALVVLSLARIRFRRSSADFA